jgi:hypothetical protein
LHIAGSPPKPFSEGNALANLIERHGDAETRIWRVVIKVWRGRVWFNQLECGHTFQVIGTKTNPHARHRICHACERATWRAAMGLREEAPSYFVAD